MAMEARESVGRLETKGEPKKNSGGGVCVCFNRLWFIPLMSGVTSSLLLRSADDTDAASDVI